MLYRDNEHLLICNRCGLVYTKIQMTLKGMRHFYNENYFVSDDSLQKGYEHYFNARENIIKTFNKRMDLLQQYHNKPGRLLDVGCAAGFFLHTAKERGWDVAGVDISKICAAYARDHFDIEVENKLFTDTDFKDESFDMITMWDYLEHSITPKEDIVKSWDLLRKDGLLAIATPDISSLPSRIFKSNWIGIKLEEHFYYFSKDLLKKNLIDTGFSVLDIFYIGKYVSSAMAADRLIFYNRFLSRSLGNILKKLNLSFYCNPFDIMLVIGKKEKAKKI
jgi:2-polyprenyl-3-methyl-5-hydroxy-6-metoxy-1,4-benzoquinol methylase